MPIDTPRQWRMRRVGVIADMVSADWDRLLSNDQPFPRHAFLDALETTGVVDSNTGWQPCHLTLEDRQSRLRAAAFCYRKSHSFGEFVFDFAWAHAYRQLGLAYYPKLVCAVPFTPVVGPRLLATDTESRAALANALDDHAAAAGCASWHVLFPQAADRAALSDAGAILRRDCHYHWLNRGYRDFDDFLAALSSKRRKEIRRERRRLHAAGVEVVPLRPREIDAALWNRIYAFYARTYLVRGQAPYLTEACLREMAHRLPNQVLFFVAFRNHEPLGMAFMLDDGDTLYGRHWGAEHDYDGLHFETCYYAGIDYCIRHGRRRFDAGAQGEHKVRRGFEPMATFSAHRFQEPRLHAAIDDFVTHESQMVADYHAEQRRRSAFPDSDSETP